MGRASESKVNLEGRRAISNHVHDGRSGGSLQRDMARLAIVSRSACRCTVVCPCLLVLGAYKATAIVDAPRCQYQRAADGTSKALDLPIVMLRMRPRVALPASIHVRLSQPANESAYHYCTRPLARSCAEDKPAP